MRQVFKTSQARRYVEIISIITKESDLRTSTAGPLLFPCVIQVLIWVGHSNLASMDPRFDGHIVSLPHRNRVGFTDSRFLALEGTPDGEEAASPRRR